MLIKEKIGTLLTIEIKSRKVDYLLLEWYETGKCILHKKTVEGREVVLKFLNASSPLMQDDVLYESETFIIVVAIMACDVITIKPKDMYAMAQLCYEIGNKHLPLFYEEEVLMIPHDPPLYFWLQASGFEPNCETRKLLQPLRTSVSAHGHSDSNSLFSKILKLTSPANE